MASQFKTLFTAHPDAVGESYAEHFAAASGYSLRLFKAGGAAFIHAFLPFLFEKTASNAIKAMYADMTRRGATPALPPEQPTALVAE